MGAAARLPAMSPPSIDSATIRRARAELVDDPGLAGRNLARRLAQQADSWFEGLAVELPAGWALAATGGYGGGAEDAPGRGG